MSCHVMSCHVMSCVMSCRVMLCCYVMLCYKLFTCKVNCSSHSFMTLPSPCHTVRMFSKYRSFMIDLVWSCSSQTELLFGSGISRKSVFEQEHQYFVVIHITFLLIQILFRNFLPSIRLPRGISRRTCPKVEALCKMVCTRNLKCSVPTWTAKNVLKWTISG
jgi:hypothetical protein